MKGLTLTYIYWAAYSLSSLLLSIWIAWHVASYVNFLYPIWYSLLNIDQTVEQTMPKHLYKKEFIATDTEEHHRLFSEIVSSIQNSGKGLEKIEFFTPTGQKLGNLLTTSEITHLQDVANLIDLLGWFALVVLIICLMLLALMIFFRVRMPTIKRLSMLVFAGVSVLVIIVLLLDAKKMFYWLHTVVFPSDHQWFFIMKSR